ncbi:hypothetical protein SOQ14_09525 [Erythrobacter sp. T5W1-R]|uniref:hypothetical protein n=1 Tax=Erythrobacter sp. T5W1-R TaxID=3101752 RepID=UPI002AFECCA2|nr:hypothetical protein [Erythrobacter sp. T5W1-R]MEA1619158.1 hypothetical protein [Erythrobacter sp. T5W1-R]
MRFFIATLAFLSAQVPPDQDWPGTRAIEPSWEKDPVIVDAQGICNPEASSNVFVQIDVKLWRNEFRQNCWWPAFATSSRYFMKTFDWGIGGGVQPVDRATGRIRPIEVWVQGLHQGDRGVPYRRSLTLYRIDCARGTNRYAAVQFIAYGADGKVLEQWDRPSAASRAAVPGSKEEAFAAAVWG